MPDARGSRSRFGDLSSGGALGFLIGLVAKDLDLAMLVSFWGDEGLLVVASALLGAIMGLTSLRRILVPAAAASALLWLVVGYSPITRWMAAGLDRREAPVPADAVFVLASGLQRDGELSTAAMSRLLKGLQLLSEGFAPRLVLSELPPPFPQYRDAACQLMDSLGLSNEIATVGPVRNTHDEAIAVAELARDFAFAKVLVVTSPTHSRRAAAALEAQRVEVVAVPAVETSFDFENLGADVEGTDRIRAFGFLVHEYVGFWYYQLRGWIDP
jgi:uncharacterized SAM-binding protein YcdF (DUF218 family)